jgi:hypothetical protein
VKGEEDVMSVLSVVLFIHVSSARLLFAALALEGTVLMRIRSSRSAEHARSAVLTFQRLRAIYMPAFLGVLVGGGYLASRYGSGTGWIPVSLLATFAIMLVGGIVTGRRISRLQKIASMVGSAVAFEAIAAQTRAQALVLSYGFRAGLAVAIVFLMTTQPELLLSVIALAIGSLAGVILAAGLTARTSVVHSV